MVLAQRVAIMLFLACSASARASDCSAILVQDKHSFKFDDSSSYALYKLTRTSSSSDQGFDGSVTLPVDGLPVSFGVSEKDKDTNSYFENTNLDWSERRIVSVASQMLSKNAVEAYKSCVAGGSDSPVKVIVSDATPTAATITVIFSAPVGVQLGRVYAVGGKLDYNFPRSWRSGQQSSVTLKRNRSSDVRLVANIGPYPATEFVSRIPPPPYIPSPPPSVQSQTALFVGRTPDVNAGEVTTNPNHKNGATVAYGYAIKNGPDAGQVLYVGLTQNANAAIVNIGGGGWRGGQTQQIGWAIKVGRQKPGDRPLYAGMSADHCQDAVSDYEHFQGCNLRLIGYARSQP